MIRKAKGSDSKDIALVLKKSYKIDTMEEAKQVFLEERKKGYVYLVTEVDGKIVGLTTWCIHGLPKHGLCELDRICVLPKFRGRGIAKALFQGLISDAKKSYSDKGYKLRKLYLLTHESNATAHKFYEKIGLKKEAVLKKHYYNNEDERVYSMFF